MRKAALTLMASTVISGCSGGTRTAPTAEEAAATAEIEEAQSALDEVKAAMLDPNSAMFQNVRFKGDNLCGEINAKNRMGGYVGFRDFAYSNGSVLVTQNIDIPSVGSYGMDIDNLETWSADQDIHRDIGYACLLGNGQRRNVEIDGQTVVSVTKQ